MLEELRCPDCGKPGTLRRQRDGEGWFCGTRLGGCAAMFELTEPAIIRQLSPRAQESIRARVERKDGPAIAPSPADGRAADLEVARAWVQERGGDTAVADMLLAQPEAAEGDHDCYRRALARLGAPPEVLFWVNRSLPAAERRAREGRSPPAAG